MTATYSPEDNKLRLYVGRVPRDEYLKLRAEGWTSTPKQSCDFVATWTPQRRNTCLEYADLIEDEDQGPEDRAADRAERFGEYRDKRTSEATGHADNFDSGPAVHGYQSQARAERSARRHDRQAGYALDAWSKAEYWQRRTAGVIAHALYKSTPGVRMGRIKTIEAELRKHVAEVEKRTERWNTWKRIEAITDPTKQTETALYYTGHSSSLLDWAEYKHPRTGAEAHSLYCLLSSERASNQNAGRTRCGMSGFHRLHTLRMENDAAGFAMDEMRPRFERLAGRHENGTAPRALSVYQLFQTPPELAQRLAAALDMAAGGRILEPSAGLGRLLDAVAPLMPAEIVAVELNAGCAGELFRQDRAGVTIKQRDFLTVTPEEIGTFDAVIMNPPFHMRDDIKHILQVSQTGWQTRGHLHGWPAPQGATNAALLILDQSPAKDFQRDWDECKRGFNCFKRRLKPPPQSRHTLGRLRRIERDYECDDD